ncbi:MAG: sigma factor-like helix-turn-helix DNA-binding protein, partial [Planctomycetota bacterium]
ARRVVEEDRLTPRRSEDPAEVAALAEFSQELVLALQALPDNYREVLWLHLADGKRPSEIAQDLHRAPGTVRMQVHRGLDLLRRSLPEGFAAQGLVGLASTRGLEAVRADVLARALAKSQANPLAGAPAAQGGALAALKASSATIAWLVGVAALVALALGAWWRLGDPAASRTSELQTAALVEPAADAPAAARATAPERNALANEAAVPADASHAGIFLRGRVSGPGADQLAQTRLSVRGIARFQLPAELQVEGTPAADGSFELEVSRLLAAARPGRPIEELVLEAEHPRYVHTVVHVPLLTGRAASDARDPTESGYTADVEMARAGLVSGRGELSDAAPAAGASALLFALADGLPLEPAVDRVVCAADGSFELRARQDGDHAIVLIQGGLRPVTRVASLTPGFSSPLGTLVLDEGAAIDGQAFHMDLPMRKGAMVSANATREGTPYAFDRTRFLWRAGAFERSGSIVETDADGRFRVSGLAPGPYKLGVSRAAPEGAPASQRRLVLSTAAWTAVDAPASRVEIHASFAMLHLRVATREQLEAPPTAQVRVRQASVQDGGAVPGVAEFPLEFGALASVSVEARGECQVHVEAKGFVARDVVVTAREPGEEDTLDLLLERDGQLAQLSIELHAPADEPVVTYGELTCSFAPAGSNTGQIKSFVRRAKLEDGRFLIADLPAGEWSVSVFAGSVYEHFRDLWCEAKREVRLSAGGVSNVSFVLQRGGQLEISAANAAGSLLPAQCTIRGADGALLSVEFSGRLPDRSGKSTRVLSDLSPSTVRPILPAGSYQIDLGTKGYEPAQRFVQIRAGATERVQVVLQAKAP